MKTSKITKTVDQMGQAAEVAYKKVEGAVVGAYQTVEDRVVSGYTWVEDAFVEKFLIRDGETVEEAKERLKNQVSSQ